MSEHKIEEGVIENAEVLDLSSATEEEIERIKKIVNACVLEKNVTPELISQKIKEIRNYGKIIVPRLSYGSVISKISQNAGKLRF